MPLLAFAMGLMLARMLVMAQVLDVPNFAAFSAGVLVSSTFGMLACLGLQPMLLRDLSIQIVKQRERPGLVLLAQCVVVAIGCAIAGLVLAVTGCTAASLPGSLFGVAVIHGLAQQIFLVATVESRCRGMPVRFARQNLVRALAVLGLGATTAEATGSALWALVVEAIVSLALAQWTLHQVFEAAQLRAWIAYRLAVRRLARVQWRSAIALMATTVVSFGLINADRWVAAEVLSVDQFAQYGFAWMVLMVAQSVQVVINAAVFPMLARRFAAQGRRAAFLLSARASCAAFVCTSIAAVPLWMALDFAVTNWFSDYMTSIQLFPLLIATSVFRVSDFWSSFMMVVGLEATLVRVTLLAGSLGVILWVTIVQPWTGAPFDLLDIAGLAIALAAVTYLATALASWRACR
jgi:O-antigen/teichoic acid export membrane protein